MMKRVLILGGTGMLGHKLVQKFRNRFDTWVTARNSFSRLEKYGIYDPSKTVSHVDSLNPDSILSTVGKVQPEVVINCIGIIKQLDEAKDPVLSLKINSLFPHQLAMICKAAHARMIHVSTDCVFNGRKGMYVETDPSDAEDLYGKTKFLGEVSGDENALTLRTSIIGREMTTSKSLIDWFLSQRGKTVNGYEKAVYTGLTTHAFADILADVINHHPKLHGLYQVSADPINKYELLKIVNECYHAGITIQKDSQFFCDRSLDSSKFRKITGYRPPAWETMIEEMAHDPTDYEAWHKI